MRTPCETSVAPGWVAPQTLEAMRAAAAAALARGLRGAALAEVVREVVLARHPALPASMIGQAVASVPVPVPSRPARLRAYYRLRLPGRAPGRPNSQPWP